jgi:hypothetical protein
MGNQINGTPKATFYLNELASDMAEFVIEEKYSGTGVEVLIERDGVMVYDDNIQEEYDLIYNKIFNYLQINKIK